MKDLAFAPAIAVCFVLIGCSPDSAAPPQPVSPAEPAPSAGTIVNDAALANENDTENWLAFGRTYSEQRYSPLDQINDSNVSQLGVDWYIPLPNARGLTATPLVVDGVMYFLESMNRIHAVDAATGEQIWMWDPRVADNSDMRAGWEHNRGIGIWEDKVYQATWDGRMIAIDRATGEHVWTSRVFPEGLPLYITGAPKIFKGKVLIGSGGTEIGPNRGYVIAFDAQTGEEAWRFYIVPGNPADGFENDAMAMAAETWTGEWWQYGGGGNAWHGFTYDAELDVLYIGTGNGAPWNRKIRSPGGGDNLFIDSVVALDPDTGDYLWHYQNTPGESWDYNSNMDIVLADLEIDGRTVKAMMQAPKNGFFYVHDRENRSLISAEPYTEVTWATHVDMETGRPVETPQARYPDGEAIISPSPLGGHSWHAMSYNPNTGLVYIPVIQMSNIYNDQYFDHSTFRSPVFEGDGLGVSFVLYEDRSHIAGTLQARDPVTNTVAWEVPMYGVGNAGTMTTAGNLVFQGRVDGTFVAYNASTGETLWTSELGLGISAPPVTYDVDGKQYVALLVGYGAGAAGVGGDIAVANGWAYGVHERRLVVFSLDGEVQLPEQPQAAEARPISIASFEVVEEELAADGAIEYIIRCSSCHGFDAISPGMAPDLRASPILASAEAFAEVVREGSLMENGMPVYSHLTDEQLLKIRHYVRREAEAVLNQD